MADFQDDKDSVFDIDQVRKIIMESAQTTIGENAFQQGRVNQWSSGVLEQCLGQLSRLGKPFKYVVNCVIMQKSGAGLQGASSCFWDNSTDGSCTVAWENDTTYCIVTVFGMAI